MTHFAGHVHIRQELHLDLELSLSLAGFAAATFDVEGETTFLVAANLGLGQFGKQIANIIKNAGIGGWIGAGRAADGGLVNVNHFVERFGAFQAFKRAGLGVGVI